MLDWDGFVTLLLLHRMIQVAQKEYFNRPTFFFFFSSLDWCKMSPAWKKE